MSDWIYDLSVEEAGKAKTLNGGRMLDRADMEAAMRAAVEHMGALTVCSVCSQEAAHPELRGTHWRRKTSPGLEITFSRTLIQWAGGIDRLFAEWEQVPG